MASSGTGGGDDRRCDIDATATKRRRSSCTGEISGGGNDDESEVVGGSPSSTVVAQALGGLRCHSNVEASGTTSASSSSVAGDGDGDDEAEEEVAYDEECATSGSESAKEEEGDGSDGGNGENSDEDGGASSSDEDEDVYRRQGPPQQAGAVASLLSGRTGTSIRSVPSSAYRSPGVSSSASSSSSSSNCAFPLPPPPPLDLPPPPKDLSEVASFIKSDKCRSVVILAGAGMSVSSGIPDFRSAGVGMYDTLRPELLTAHEHDRDAIRLDPTAVFDRDMFLRNPLPCLELKRPFILGTRQGQWRATLAHRFVELLHAKTGKLTRLYTQNIDGLECQCPRLPHDKVVNVHGSMGNAACESCGAPADFGSFCDEVRRRIRDITGRDPDAPSTSTPVPCRFCGRGTVKPTIVLFRSPLPREFFERVVEDVPSVDLLIVVGTSLTVSPANTIVYRVPPDAMRLVVNNEAVGERLGIRYGDESVRDVFARGKCDEVFLDLACHLGWLEDLKGMLSELPQASADLLREHLEAKSSPDDSAAPSD